MINNTTLISNQSHDDNKQDGNQYRNRYHDDKHENSKRYRN